MFKEKRLFKKARALNKTIVFPEASFSERTVEAVKYIQKKKIANVILIGDESALALQDKSLANFHIINPSTFEKTPQLAKILYSKRKDKGMTKEEADKLVLDPHYFATLLVEEGFADGMVGGVEVSTSKNIKPALQIIRAEKRNGIVSSCFLIYGKNKFLKGKTLLVSDAGLIPEPTSSELVEIARQSVETYRILGLADPKLAFLSYSTHGSAKGESIDKVRSAFETFKKTGVTCDGELQLDAAMCEDVAKRKCPENPLKGDANILIYPDLNSGNINYKAMQYFGGLNAVGPILQGLKKPVNDLSRGCSVQDIIVTTAITAVQSERRRNENISG